MRERSSFFAVFNAEADAMACSSSILPISDIWFNPYSREDWGIRAPDQEETGAVGIMEEVKLRPLNKCLSS